MLKYNFYICDHAKIISDYFSNSLLMYFYMQIIPYCKGVKALFL